MTAKEVVIGQAQFFHHFSSNFLPDKKFKVKLFESIFLHIFDHVEEILPT